MNMIQVRYLGFDVTIWKMIFKKPVEPRILCLFCQASKAYEVLFLNQTIALAPTSTTTYLG